jgi:SnoaL-like polyketide cyclase
MKIEQRLADLGLQLPEATTAPPGFKFSFVWVRLAGSRAFVSGHAALAPDGTPIGPLARFPARSRWRLRSGPRGPRPWRSWAASTARVLFPAFPDQRWVTDEQISEGNKVVSRVTMYGTHRGDFMGIPATGRSIAVRGVVNGKWKDSRLLMDNLSLLQQLGALPPTPPNNNATQRHHS